MGVSKNKGTPKWMVKIMENPIIMDDLRGKPTIFGNTHFYVPILQQNYRPKMNAPFANEQP